MVVPGQLVAQALSGEALHAAVEDVGVHVGSLEHLSPVQLRLDAAHARGDALHLAHELAALVRAVLAVLVKQEGERREGCTASVTALVMAERHCCTASARTCLAASTLCPRSSMRYLNWW